MITRLRYLVALLLASGSLLMLFSAPSSAQVTWIRVAQFPASNRGWVSAMWFFNSDTGVIGFHWNNTTTTNGMVERTTDGGKNWTNCTVNQVNNTTPQISDIWFLNADTGWMTVGGSLNTADYVLYRSTDAGKTWNPNTYLLATYGSAASVIQTDSALLVTNSDGGIWTSTDTGKTWLDAKPTLRQNGLAFDHNIGVSSSDDMAYTQGTSFLITTNGGLHWDNTTLGFPHEGWSVHSIPNTGIFVAAPEDTTISGISQQSYVYRSVMSNGLPSNGLYWKRQLRLPIRTTGDIEGVEGFLYIQNCGGIPSSPEGLMESTDEGGTWASIGGPNQGGVDPTFSGGNTEPICDTRFAVTGCGNTVYAADDSAGLWKTIDAPGLMFQDIDTMRPISAVICDTTSQVYYLHNLNTSTITIQSVQILDSNRRPFQTHAVWLDSVPAQFTDIYVDDSIPFTLDWHPGAMMDSAASDSAIVRVIFYASYLAACSNSPLLSYDTVLLPVKLIGTTVPPDYAYSPKTITTSALPTCITVDTTIDLINNGCDAMTITKASLLKNAWSVSDTSGKPLVLPLKLGSGDTLRLRLRATPTSKAILFDSLQVSMHYMGQNTSFAEGLRTSATLNTNNPALTSLATLAFDSLATCDSTEEPFTLTNTGCDTLSLTTFDLVSANFELLDTNGKPLPLPLKIPTDSSRPVKIRFIPGSLGAHNAALRLHYHYFGFDSSNVITLTGTGAASGTLVYANALDFGSVSMCSSKEDTVVFRNTSCDSAWVDSLMVSPPFSLLNPITLPRWISAGGTLQLIVQYQPTAKTVETGNAYMHVWTNDAKTPNSDTVHFSGMGTAGSSTFETNPPLAAAMFNFDTLSECDHADSVTFAIYNTGCDTLRVTGLTLDPSLTGTFVALTDKPLPALIANGDTLHVTLAIKALVANTYSGNFHIDYTLADGSTHNSTMPVSLTVTTASGASALTMSSNTSFDFKTIQACAEPTPDTNIVITNTGCGTDTVFFNLTGTGFTLGGLSDTILTPGETAKIPVYYDGTTRGNLNATLAFRTNVTNNNLSSVSLIGNVGPTKTVHFKVAFSKMPVAPGQAFTASLVPDLSISGVGLHAIHGAFEYRSNNFEVFSNTMTAPPGMTLTQNGPNRVGDIETYSFDLTNPKDIPLDPTQPVVSLPMIAMVSDSVGGQVAVDSLNLNQNDTTFRTCTLASNSIALDASLSIQCGDSTLIYYLRGEPIVFAERLRPNPVTSENGYQTTLDLTSAVDGSALIALYDGLGRQVSSHVIALTHGETEPYTFDLHNLPAGSYYYELRFTGSGTPGASPTMLSGSAKGMLLLIK